MLAAHSAKPAFGGVRRLLPRNAPVHSARFSLVLGNATGTDPVRGAAAALPDDTELMAVGSKAEQTRMPDFN